MTDARAGVSRRRFVQLVGGLAAGGAVGLTARQALTTTAAASSPGGALPIPSLLQPVLQGGTKVFRLTMQQGTSQFLTGQRTATFGFNGSYLGPTLRAARGDDVLVHVTNHLGESSTLHWHGMHLPAVMDGGPMREIADGTTWSPRFTVRQPAATLWYHPHLMGQTQRQIGLGLVGLFLLDDDEPAGRALPREYGVDDVPVVLQAQSIGSDGQLAAVAGGGGRGRGGGGFGGSAVTLVNGAVAPSFTAQTTRVRLRLLNASRTEVYELGFDGGQAFHQVASDGGLLPAPVELTSLELAPAERAEIVVDVSSVLVLQSLGGNAGGGRGGFDNAAPTGAVLTLHPAAARGTATPLPAALATIARLSPAGAAQNRQLVLGGNDQFPTINGQVMASMDALMDMSRVLQVGLGTTEVWTLVNTSGDLHAFHVHDTQFQVLTRDGQAPTGGESGWKDTIVVRPNETVSLIMRFADYADPRTPYMYHCHLLNHEDNGMMGQFVVV